MASNDLTSQVSPGVRLELQQVRGTNSAWPGFIESPENWFYAIPSSNGVGWLPGALLYPEIDRSNKVFQTYQNERFEVTTPQQKEAARADWNAYTSSGAWDVGKLKKAKHLRRWFR